MAEILPVHNIIIDNMYVLYKDNAMEILTYKNHH